MNRPILFAALAVLALVPPTAAHALSLEQAIGLARGNSPSLQAADASVSRAEHAIGQARAALSPRVSMGGSYVQNSEAPKTVFIDETAAEQKAGAKPTDSVCCGSTAWPAAPASTSAAAAARLRPTSITRATRRWPTRPVISRGW